MNARVLYLLRKGLEPNQLSHAMRIGLIYSILGSPIFLFVFGCILMIIDVVLVLKSKSYGSPFF